MSDSFILRGSSYRGKMRRTVLEDACVDFWGGFIFAAASFRVVRRLSQEMTMNDLPAEQVANQDATLALDLYPEPPSETAWEQTPGIQWDIPQKLVLLDEE